MSRQRYTSFRLWIVIAHLLTGSIVTATEPQQTEQRKGLTTDDLLRGLQSAAQNIEKEIPKIGPAIGKTITSASKHSSEKKPSQPLPTGKK